MRIEAVTEVTDAVCDAFGSLIAQLSSSAKKPTPEALTSIVASDTTTIWMAVDDADNRDRIVGFLTLILYCIPTGKLARIEDVVVEQSMRRRGIGRMLMEVAIEHAWEAGVKAVDLTSNPARSAANQLYLNMGFVQRETNVYRLLCSSHDEGIV